MNALKQRLADCRPLAETLCNALRTETAKLGFGTNDLPAADAGTAAYRLESDPASGSESLLGEWHDRHGYRIGMLLFHGDGSFFAEHDIAKPHPTDPSLFVEAIEAWGRDNQLCCEPRLLSMIEDADQPTD
ncbi:MAG: hypothetical protein N838_19605 [Thiohalocapsa sp. PB-PSB1]|nr:MAG: hypothetical protein N838_19605 [Thiohalocapsa sp. PB-PSB1]